MVGSLGSITGGSGGTAGTYGGVSLTGGSGSGATANVTVSGGAVTAVSILNPGTQYVTGDVLSASSGSIGGVTGFSVPVASTAINGSLAGGTVAFYVPNTLTFKQTWQNAGQTILNTNPVVLDSNGCAVIYGAGSYRQILKDSLGNTVWDQITTDTSASNSVFWAGIAGGTPNVITITDPGFNGTDGTVINFTAISTNTSAATLNPSGFGAIPILKDTTGGPVSLTGTEIIQNNPISVVFRASDNAFHLLNTAIASASGATAPLCGATHLKITNNGSTPNTIINLTADQIVMQSPSGLTINRSNVSLTAINITTGTITPTANGMDGEAVGTNNFIDIWAIDNGSASAGLVSLASGNGLSPNMPSGYTYKCRLGQMKVDGSGNLYRTLQRGQVTEFTLQNSGNTNAIPTVISGGAGSWTGTVVQGVSGTTIWVPDTASAIKVTLYAQVTNHTIDYAAAAPNGNYALAGLNNSGTSPPLLCGTNLTTNTNFCSVTSELTLQSTSIFYSAILTSGIGGINVNGWRDSVNAN